ncbi:hypothetical protein VNO77_34729 [Canavalia gladiata]|uniref:Uncharacterized protein n=1 Tax=Canavalia gladiata TaxID=3824 RepID=A0AAN9KHX0_CANGL
MLVANVWPLVLQQEYLIIVKPPPTTTKPPLGQKLHSTHGSPPLAFRSHVVIAVAEGFNPPPSFLVSFKIPFPVTIYLLQNRMVSNRQPL